MDAGLRSELAAAEDSHWWFEARRRILAGVLTGLPLPSDARILEAGCGNGANLAMLSRFGSVTGFEPDRVDLERAQQRGIGRIIHGALPALPSDLLSPEDTRAASAGFDVILALDVIEHVDEDVASLRSLLASLAPTGCLIITVPGHQWLWGRHDVRNDHRRRYSKESLRQALLSADASIDRLTWFNSRLFLPVVLMRTIGKLVGADGAGTAVPPERINRVLTNVMAGESSVLDRRNQRLGVSLLAVARNQNVDDGSEPPASERIGD